MIFWNFGNTLGKFWFTTSEKIFLVSKILEKLCREMFCYYFIHCLKSVQIRSFFLVHIFLYWDWIRRFTIQSEYKKIRTRKNSVYGHFSHGDLLCKFPYWVRTQENTDQIKLRIWTIFTQSCHFLCSSLVVLWWHRSIYIRFSSMFEFQCCTKFDRLKSSLISHNETCKYSIYVPTKYFNA